MAKQTAREFLHAMGVEDDEITRAIADADQYRAEVDHLISIAVGVVIAETHEESMLLSIGLRGHLTDVPAQVRPLFAAILFRAGQIAASLTTKGRKVDELTAKVADLTVQLEQQASGRGKWWRGGRP